MHTACGGHSEEMVDDCPSNPLAPRCSGSVHRLQFGVVVVELLDGSDTEKLTVDPKTEECDGGVEETFEVESVNVLGWAVLVGEGQVLLEERANIVSPRIVEFDDKRAHSDLIPAARTACSQPQTES